MIYRSLLLPCLSCGLLAQAPPARPLPQHPPVAPAVGAVRTPAPSTAPDRASRTAAAVEPFAARERALSGNVPAPSAPSSLAAMPDRVLFDETSVAGGILAIGSSWKAAFDGTGFAYTPFLGSDAPRNFPLRVEVQSATVDGVALPLQPGRPQRDGHRVRTARGAMTEVVDLALQQAEQSFVFDQLPQRGELVVEVRLAGEFQTMVAPGGLLFTNAHGIVDYTHAVARDAAGQSQPLDIVWLGDRARIAIPQAFVASARLPLVLDPVLATRSVTGPYNPLRTQRLPDVARQTVTGITAVTWRRAFSIVDEDVCVALYDASMNLYSLQYIDQSAESWVTTSIAACSYSNNFLVVSQVDTQSSFSGSYIAGRLVDTNGLMSAPIVIEGRNQVGMAGNNFRPDVGGDGYPSPQAYFTIVFEHEASLGNHDIYLRQLDQTGALRTAMPIALDTGATMQENPSISAWNGPDVFARALVAWQSANTVATGTEDILGAWVDWAGGVPVPAFVVSQNWYPERRPSVSSIANVLGATCAAVVWETDYGTDNDVDVQLIDSTGGAFGQRLDLGFAESGGTYLLRNQQFPTVETDGNRFVVGYSEYSGTDYDTYASTIAWLPVSATWRIHDDRAQLGVHVGTDDYWTRMVADWNFYTPVPNSEYTIVGADIGSNDIELRRYGGHVPGPAFSPFGSQCGALGITPSGSPTTGGYVHFDLVAPGPFSGFLFGFPGYQTLPPCTNCVLAVANGVSVPGPHYSWHVPSNPVLVNAFTLSVQGWSFGGTACLAAIDLSNTIDFRIH